MGEARDKVGDEESGGGSGEEEGDATSGRWSGPEVQAGGGMGGDGDGTAWEEDGEEAVTAGGRGKRRGRERREGGGERWWR